MNTKCTTLVLACLSLLVSIASYGQGELNGSVLDKATQDPIPYANIIIKSDNTITTGGISDDSGDFSVSKIPFG